MANTRPKTESGDTMIRLDEITLFQCFRSQIYGESVFGVHTQGLGVFVFGLDCEGIRELRWNSYRE